VLLLLIISYFLPVLTAVAEVRFSRAFVCLSVCLSVYPHDISKTAAARITKLDTEMFHDESRKPIYFGVERSEFKVTVCKSSASVGFCTLASADFF